MARKINVIFRWSADNHYTLSALTGLLDEKLSPRKFSIAAIESINDIVKEVRSSNSVNVLCYSFMITDFDWVSKEIKHLKNILTDRIIVICGGSFTSALPNKVLDAGADVVFLGEAEESLPLFLNNLYYSKEVLQKRIVQPIELNDFDDYPPFAYKRKLFGPIELRRGCLNRCSFCQTPQIFPKVRERSIEYVKHYNKYLIKSDRGRTLFIIADALLYGAKAGKVNLPHLERFLSEIKKSRINIIYGMFPSEISPHSLVQYPKAAEILKKYVQNNKIIVGAQSGSAKVLKAMNRKDNLNDIVESVRILKSNGFMPIVDILLGIPGENKDDRMQTMEFMKTLFKYRNVKFNMHYFLPLPGTEFENMRPEPVEKVVKQEILKFIKNGVVIGDFFKQLEFSKNLA
jgi:B12-binding domain/radical SAM domain protein